MEIIVLLLVANIALVLVYNFKLARHIEESKFRYEEFQKRQKELYSELEKYKSDFLEL